MSIRQLKDSRKMMGSSSSKKPQPPQMTSRTIAAATRNGKYGLFLLNPKGSSRRDSRDEYPIDIVAVHGFTGDAFTTWQHKNGEFWLQSFLPKEFPGARIFSFGYNAEPFSRGTGGFETFANTLLEDLAAVRLSRDEQRRPIIFICHSMGGLIVKKALVMSMLNEELAYSNIRMHTSAILFLATPHRGADVAGMAAILANITNISLTSLAPNVRSDIIKSLKKEAPELRSLARDFRGQTANIRIASFFEEKRMLPFKERIVDDFSGVMDIAGERIVPMMDSDHRDICQFPDEKHHSYKRVLNVLKDVAYKAVQSQSRRQ